jgi:hypothetical protein
VPRPRPAHPARLTTPIEPLSESRGLNRHASTTSRSYGSACRVENLRHRGAVFQTVYQTHHASLSVPARIQRASSSAGTRKSPLLPSRIARKRPSAAARRIVAGEHTATLAASAVVSSFPRSTALSRNPLMFCIFYRVIWTASDDANTLAARRERLRGAPFRGTNPLAELIRRESRR